MKVLILVFLLITGQYLFGQLPQLMLPKGHTLGISFLQLSPNFKMTLTVSEDQTAKVWQTETGKLLMDITAPIASFSPDWETLFLTNYGSSNGVLFRHDGTFIELIGHWTTITGGSFSSDGKRILTSSHDNTCRIWDVKSGRQLFELKGHTSVVTSAIFSPDNKEVLSCSSIDGLTGVWDAETGKIKYFLKRQERFGATFSPDSKKIVTVSLDKKIKVWDVSSGKLLHSFKNESDITSVTFSPDGKKIVSTSWGLTAKIWSAESGKLLGSFLAAGNYAIFSNNSQTIFTFSQNGEVKRINTKNGEEKVLISENTEWIGGGSLKLSADGLKLFCTFKNGMVKIVNSETGIILTQFKASTKSTKYSALSPDNGYVALTSFSDNNIRIWDLELGKMIKSLDMEANVGDGAVFSPEGNVLTSLVDYNKIAKIWDKSTNLTQDILLNRDFSYFSYISTYSRDGKKFLIYSADEIPRVFNSETGGVLFELVGHKDFIETALFSSDGKMIITSSRDKTVKIWNSETGVLINSFEKHKDEVTYAEFSPDNKWAVSSSRDETVKVWDVLSGKVLFDFSTNTNYKNKALFSPDGQTLLTVLDYWKSTLWDLKTGRALGEFDGKPFVFSKDGNYFLTLLKDGIAFWNKGSANMISKTLAEGSIFNDADFTNKRIVGTSSYGLKLYDFEKGKLIADLIPFEKDDYFTQIPSGYYQCTPNAAKLLHYVTNDLKVITFEQLDVKYNRPDKVLEAIGNTDTTLINSYKKAYYKRIKKLEIDTTSFEEGYSVPESDFKNRDDIEYEQKNEELKLVINGVDSTYKLDRFNIWINEIPLFGKRGISIRDRKSNQLDTIITVQLSQGENRIETSIMNVNGTESYRMPLYVKYMPTNPVKEKVHFIGIGIDKFADSTYNLRYSVKDIRDLAKKLREKYGENIEIDTLLNQQVTVGAIKSLKKKLLTTNVSDKVIISYSGHGMLSKDFDYYLSTYSVHFNHPEENGLSYDDLESLLDSIPARNKLLLIDACHSGEVDKQDLMAMKESSDSLIKGARIYAYKEDEKHLGLKNSFELMQNLFVNVGKSTGATIISAAAGTQFALERNDLKNGVFTYCILDAMNNYPTMKVSELKKTVGEQVEKITKGLQKPTSRNETINSDWKVW